MIYLAQPYYHIDSDVMEQRYDIGCYVTAQLMLQGLVIFAPIVYCHELAKRYTLPRAHDFWLNYDFAMLARSDKMLIIGCDGWNVSRGVREEVEEAERLQIEIRIIPDYKHPSKTILLGDYNGKNNQERGPVTTNAQGNEPG